MVNIKSPLNELKGVGPTLAGYFEDIDLKTVDDLVYYLPRRWDDYSHITTISNIRPGLVSLRVKITPTSERRARRGLSITEAVAKDKTGAVRVVWFNQPYRARSLQPNKEYYLSGEYDLYHQRLQIVNPNIELAENAALSQTARILPIYRENKHINSVLIRKLMVQLEGLILNLKETLPGWIVEDYGLMAYGRAVKNIHLPDSQQALIDAKRRLAFEELFVLIMATQLLKAKNQTAKSLPIKFDLKVAKIFVDNLDFNLTDSQRQIVWQVYKDLDSIKPMNRLVEGDVGSGKTVIAAMASLMVANANMQVAFIAPTQLLANQHATTLSNLFAHSELKDKVALLTSALKPKQKSQIKQRLKDSDVKILVGTHALFGESLDWQKLGLIIIDEQHRFGVEQRQKLFKKAGHMPHVLCLTATPIPRSLALTVYGELDISILGEVPKHKAGVDTVIVSPNSKQEMYDNIAKQLKAGHQVFVVCPLITESDILQVASAEKTHQDLSQKQFKNWRVGLLHGRLKAEQKDQVMRDFVNKKLDVLVSTTVIEVGVDVPNATVMVIEGADRFGLAQLHQLRGRVGRAQHKGICYLVMSDSSAPSRRMQAIAEN